MQARDMFPFAIPTITSLAASALQRWSSAAESRPAATAAQPQAVDFQTLLNSLSSAKAGSGAQPNLAALPEVKAALASSGSGTPVQFAISPDGSLSRVLPGGQKQAIALSAQSQAMVQQWASANPGVSSLSFPG